jgi:hypothetical protein
MGAEPKQRRLGLHDAGGPQDQLPILGVLPAPAELREPARQALDPDDLEDLEVGVLDLGPELLGMVEEGGREPVRPALRVAVLALVQVAFHDRTKLRVEQDPRARPSKSEPNREMAAAKTTPSGPTTRAASRRARIRSSRSVRW